MNFDEWINEKSLRQTISHKDVCDFINEGGNPACTMDCGCKTWKRFVAVVKLDRFGYTKTGICPDCGETKEWRFTTVSPGKWGCSKN
ncbi:MAG: hypothetical protein AAB334_02840 [Patescibacteria group bacterium]